MSRTQKPIRIYSLATVINAVWHSKNIFENKIRKIQKLDVLVDLLNWLQKELSICLTINGTSQFMKSNEKSGQTKICGIN